jgi:N-acetylmuramoyl-L-alanine amidase
MSSYRAVWVVPNQVATSLPSQRSPVSSFAISCPGRAFQDRCMTLTRALPAAATLILAAALVVLPGARSANAQSTVAGGGALASDTPAAPGERFIAGTDAAETAPSTTPAGGEPNAEEIECIAKVVHHEAGNQSRDGQIAVAYVMLNRSRSGRFPSSICAVASQPGQFFNLASYRPRRDTATWRAALDVARAALAGEPGDASRGAMFFHAAYARPSNFFRGRQRVARLEDHIFYR